MKKALFILLVFCTLFVFSNRTDSLLISASKEKSEAKKLKQMMLAFEMAFNSNDLMQANEIALKIRKIFSDPGPDFYFSLATLKDHVNELDSAVYFYSITAELYREINKPENALYAEAQKGYVYYKQAKYEEALQIEMEVFKTSEKKGFKPVIAKSSMYIGYVLRDQSDFKKALKYFKMASKYAEEIGDRNIFCACLNETGNIYNMLQEYEKALEFHLEAMECQKEGGEDVSMGYIYNDIGNDYLFLDNIEEALKYFYLSLNIGRKFENKQIIIVTNLNIGTILNSRAKYGEALNCLDEALNESVKLNLKQYVASVCEVISQSYAGMKNFEKAYEYHILFKQYNDSVFNEEKAGKLAELNTLFETEMMNRENELLKKDNNLKDLENKRQSQLINSLIIGSIVFTAFLIVIVVLFFQKKKANILLEKQNKEIREQKEEISKKNEELLQQQEEIRAINDQLSLAFSELTSKNTDIIQSIEYAQTIQQAILPDQQAVDMVFPENFIFHRPKDIIGGDFYWVFKNENYRCFVAADCTGHGVPGAMMSMLGVSFLNEIAAQNISDTGKILNILREKIIETLKQKHDKKTKDGMDLSICIFSNNTRTMSFSGANNPVFIVPSQMENSYSESNEKIKQRDGLFELTPDKMPIGIHVNRDVPFFTVTCSYNPGDMLYLSSDGFADQFGGSDDIRTARKYMNKKLRELFVSIAQAGLAEQKTLLEKEFYNWKGQLGQIDDVLVVGIRLT
ncbi:MAG: hypothetical protein A2W91_14550 [Bacteroidetes bacterium GWF2_38_335]|nr:MAG: hypothetical protein A2W91_14550 [Bacteroidetes bacterium GWF2_38_335]OFY79322.1 MAG: hypothetical protein A2281_16605 [Bacteroidetes bacterium RIFOXYA12_FULL_38_20]HBS85579.1 hypothetical protein [Bacteroidales bacterium]